MKRARKMLALLLSCALLTGVIGCGAKETGGAAGGTDAAGEQAAVDSKSILNEVGTYPIVKEPIELKIFCLSAPNVEDLETNDFTKYMEEKTGIKMIFETGTRDDYATKLNLAFSTGDYPDVIMWVKVDQAKYGVKENILIQLDDLIEENMPNYTAALGDKIDITRQTDGHIYAISGVNECYHCQYAKKMWVNMDWIEKMGVEVPTTTDEFYEVCKKYIETNPNGIAIGGANKGWHAMFEEFIMNSFAFSPGKVQSFRDETALNKDGKIVTVAASEGYKKGLEYMNSLYKLGAIYDGNFTQTEEQLRALANQEGEPVLFLPAGTISNHFDATTNPETYKHYQAMAPLKGPDGVQNATYFKNDGLEEGVFYITDKCKYPEAALRWADYFFTYQGSLEAQFGADEGKDWVMNPEGMVGLNDEPALYEILNPYSGDPQNHDWQDVNIPYRPAEFRLGQATDPSIDKGTPEGLEKLLYDATKEKMEPYAQTGEFDILPTLKLTDEEATSIQTIGVEVQNYIEENKVAFITGTKDINKDWDAYVQGFDNVGLPKLLEVYQIAYDRQK